MSVDPWSRPTQDEMQRLLQAVHPKIEGERRMTIRRPLRIPAELVTPRGNVVPAMTREISSRGVGLIHRGAVPSGEAWLQLAGDTAENRHRIRITWCLPCANGMFLSGGYLVANAR